VGDAVRTMMAEPLRAERMVADWTRNIHAGVRRTAAIARSSDPSLAAYFKEDQEESTRSSGELQKALEQAGFKPEMAEVTMKPGTETELKGDDAAKMQRLLDALEVIDDVQDVYTTALMESA
jgi:hypothetical protein